jgi:hypothetical protein
VSSTCLVVEVVGGLMRFVRKKGHLTVQMWALVGAMFDTGECRHWWVQVLAPGGARVVKSEGVGVGAEGEWG